VAWPPVQAWSLHVALPSSSRQNWLLAQVCASVLPLPVLSHFHTEPPLQSLVFGTHAVSAHAPSAHVCDGKQVCSIVRSDPSSLQILTFRPSHDLLPGSQTRSGRLPELFELPLQAATKSPTPISAHAARPIVLPITITPVPKTPTG
jgi:hypothetical protein